METYTWNEIKFFLALMFIAGVGIGIYIDIYILDRFYRTTLGMGVTEMKRQYKQLIDKKCQQCADNCQETGDSENTQKPT